MTAAPDNAAIALAIEHRQPDMPQWVLDPLYVVPEPQVWALLIIGFIMVGAAMRRARVTV